jgi:hypothetical protein
MAASHRVRFPRSKRSFPDLAPFNRRTAGGPLMTGNISGVKHTSSRLIENCIFGHLWEDCNRCWWLIFGLSKREQAELDVRRIFGFMERTRRDLKQAKTTASFSLPAGQEYRTVLMISVPKKKTDLSLNHAGERAHRLAKEDEESPYAVPLPLQKFSIPLRTGLRASHLTVLSDL